MLSGFTFSVIHSFSKSYVGRDYILSFFHHFLRDSIKINVLYTVLEPLGHYKLDVFIEKKTFEFSSSPSSLLIIITTESGTGKTVIVND